MYIKEIVIDGFKSYANRTVVNGWDQLFNAITGLNGSGKSNILDAICFVLGISNLSQVRVKNLNELVYKKGQSRVTKASVTLVFDNSDTATSPVGYEQYEELTITRQIVIGGRNKYLINGHTAQLGRVQNLFHSVGLNVNNPHFLIMQGRITKVCNMKPPEILGMIEEAAGTRMYENKKLAAQKTILKKQVKVEEINKILVEEITPQLEKLRKEKSAYIQWSSNNTEVERLERYTVAHRYTELETIVEEATAGTDGMRDDMRTLERQKEDLQQEQSDLGIQMKALMAKKEEQLSAEFHAHEKRVNEESKQLVKHTSVWQHSCDNIAEEHKNHATMTQDARKLREAIESKQAEIDVHRNDVVSESERKLQEVTNEVATLQSQQLGVNFGDDSKQQQAQGTLANQLMDTQRRVTDCDAVIQSSDMKMKQMRADLKEQQSELKTCETEHKKLVKELKKHESSLAKIDKELAAKGFSFERKQELETERTRVHAQLTESREIESRLQAKLRHCMNFEYTAPPRFDKRRVKGLVANLMHVKDVKHATALEVTAGSKLYNVVVDTESTGKTLLEKGKLKRRVTIIPLNKIQSRSIDAKRVHEAEKLVGAENVHTALSLVGYDDDVDAAMRHVFGRTFICPSASVAKEVTFDKHILTPSVTYDGDLYDPSGTLTGGSAASGASVLMQLRELNAAQDAAHSLQQQLDAIETELGGMVADEESARDLSMQKELCCHQIALMNTRLSQSDFSQITAEIDQLHADIDALKASMTDARNDKKALQKKCTELKRAIKDFEAERMQQKKRIQSRITAAKKQLKTLTATHKAAKQVLDKLVLELNSLNDELQQAMEALEQSSVRLTELQAASEQLANVVAERRSEYENASAVLEAERQKIVATEATISELNAEKDGVKKRITATTLRLKELKLKMKDSESETTKAKKSLVDMIAKYAWIEDECRFFGQEHSDYDFRKHDPKDAKKRLQKLKADQEKLSRKINKKVMGSIEKTEHDFQDLMSKREQIERDKAKIEQVIMELDQKKDETLQNTWQKVNRDLGSIFSTLLPGAMAKVEPQAGMSVLDGLELKVAFGKVWKQSLSELSGGQRSLLALSLILALLLFKPAPMYILDEVDAALDLSHTQNIGQMLRTHFPHSQFIVVSLKEGMFNNANVIFRTKFVDGVSQVSRSTNKQRKRQAIAM